MLYFLGRTHSIRSMCNFPGSVSQQQRFEMDQCYSSKFYSAKFTAQSFIQQTKKRTPSRHEGLRPQKRGLSPSWLALFISFISSAPPPPLPRAQPALCNLGIARKGACLSHRKFSLGFAVFPLFSFPRLFPFFVFSHRHLGLLFPVLPT